MRKPYNSHPFKTLYSKRFLLFTAVTCFAVVFAIAVYYFSHLSTMKPVKQDSGTIRRVTAQFETEPVPRGVKDDAADDPAIWIHPFYPDSSRIIGTDKKGGLAVYEMEGKKLFYYADGEMNNADIRYRFPLAGDSIDILAVSNRTSNSVSLYRIRRNGSLEKIHKRQLISEMTDEVYGLCMYKSPSNGKYYVFINNKEGDIEQWKLFADKNHVDGRIVRKLKLSTQVEGMVADDDNSTLFVGEEDTGIWKFEAEPDAPVAGTLLSNSSEKNNPDIKFDIEGLAVYNLPAGKGYLIASSQGNDSYAVFRRESPHNYLGSFHIVKGSVDGVEGTDGLDVTDISIGNDFPKGLLVVQDGSNENGGNRVPQNFKLVRWDSIAVKFIPPLELN
jgi:3-phytase